ncbi:MAG: multiheme c-type cytochrome [Isosphaeraceae bacterium]
MSLNVKRYLIGVMGLLFLASLLLVQGLEVHRRAVELGAIPVSIVVPASSKACVDCHANSSPAIIDHWKGSTHAHKGVGCVDCHHADAGDADAFMHYGAQIATVVTPRDCSGCHPTESDEFQNSHHAKAGQILASLDNFLAETVEGSRQAFNPHGPTPGFLVSEVDGMASVNTGCRQCHGSTIGLDGTDGKLVTFADLAPGPDGKPTNADAVRRIKKNADGKPIFNASTWPNTGIGRMNLDGSYGSCSACHSRHDFSPRRARQPENCGKCHLGPDHPQEEIYNESKHGVAYRDLREHMNLDAPSWVLGKDYSQAPTCATCHMSANTRNGEKVSHDPALRISWTNRPPISLRMDTDAEGKVVTETDPEKRAKLVTDSADQKRGRMKDVCLHCHTPDYVNGFYKQYDDLVVLYNEKFAKPGQALMKALADQGLLTKQQFDEKIEWTFFYLWHHEGRRARHGASMMAPDYTHWHGMYEVAERFYMELIPEARELLEEAEHEGKKDQAEKVRAVIQEILDRPEHKWFEQERLKKAEAPRASPEVIRELASWMKGGR